MVPASLESELAKQLQELHRNHSADVAEKTEPKLIEQRLNLFETAWLERIDEHEREAVKNIEPNMQVLLDAQNAQLEARHSQRLQGMRLRDSQVAYWDHRQKGKATPDREVVDTAREQKQEQYSQLRDVVIEAVQEIAAGKELDLSRLLQKEVDRKHSHAAALEKLSLLQEREREQGRER